MTSLIYYYEPQVVFIAMDTLAMTQAKKPFIYMVKFYPLPHLQGVVCGTGSGQFVLDWFVKINSGMLVQDIPHLNEFTPEQLRVLAEKHNISNDSTVTVYQFGYSENEKCFKGYAYRSPNNFESELLPYNGIGIKPGVPFESTSPIRIPDDFIKIMEDQRVFEESRPVEERIFIGGDIQFVHMTPAGMIISRCHRFSDYESIYEKMCEGLQEKGSG